MTQKYLLLKQNRPEYTKDISDIKSRLVNVEGTGLDNKINNAISAHKIEADKRYALASDLSKYETDNNSRIDDKN